MKTVLEEAREIPVFRQADVVVVGGGPAGVGAAVTAARAGLDTVLIERYGHLGGMATGGLVILLPHMSAGSESQEIMGNCQEWIDRLDHVDGAIHPARDELGSSDPAVLNKWRDYFSFVVNDRIRQSVYYDPELLKCVLNDMVQEAGVTFFLHTWGCRAIVEDDSVKGVMFESKSGRQAILAKVTIDATGDGDIMATAGAEFEGGLDKHLRTAMLAVVFRLGNVDFEEFCAFRSTNPETWKKISSRIYDLGGFRLAPFPTNRNDVVWVNNWVPGRNCLDIGDLTWTEVEVRRVMREMRAILAAEVPGFENSFILDTASQTGTRGSRRLCGEYTLTTEDVRTGRAFEDPIALIPPLQANATHLIQIPYRSLVPKKMEGLLVAGRCFSSDGPANNMTNLIPHCVQMGEAAGAAAAVANDTNVRIRDVDYGALHKLLIKSGVVLPEVRAGTDVMEPS